MELNNEEEKIIDVVFALAVKQLFSSTGNIAEDVNSLNNLDSIIKLRKKITDN